MFARLGILLYDVAIDINKDIQEQVKFSLFCDCHFKRISRNNMILTKSSIERHQTTLTKILKVSIKKTTMATSITTINTYLANIYSILQQEISWITNDYILLIREENDIMEKIKIQSLKQENIS